jgi:hypothetical protein
MAQGKSRTRSSSTSSVYADPLDEIRDAVRTERRKNARIRVGTLELKRSVSRLGKP